MNKHIVKWELFGILFIIITGTTLHFWFEWTNYWKPIVIIAAVNESTWEHFKMAFWPGLLWTILEFFIWGKRERNFLNAKFLGLLAMPIITFILFYGYTLFWHHNLPADIVVFIASVAGGQLISLLILKKDQPWPEYFKFISLSGLGVMILAFSLLSFYPVRNFIFAHPGTGEFGILEDYSDHNHNEDDHDEDDHDEDDHDEDDHDEDDHDEDDHDEDDHDD